MKLRIAACLAAAAVLTSAGVPAGADARYSRIVVFGTSLSDSGNAFALRGGTNTPPDYDMDPLLVPQVPYTRGGHHFTDGATWVEQFARSRGLAGSVRPAFASEGKGSNYAVGAARAYEDGRNLNLSAQVEAFLQDVNHAAPADALYAIEMGGNDIRDALVAYSQGANGAAILQLANIAIAQNVQRLHAAGARNFLIWRAPNVGLTPAMRTLDRLSPGTAQFATQLTMGFNAGLDQVVAQLSALPGINIARLDAFAMITELVATPSAFGLTNVTATCVTPNVAPFHCDRPDEFLFWDGIHPTAAVHAITAQRAALALR
jgi:outer membrane lipase/esterase